MAHLDVLDFVTELVKGILLDAAELMRLSVLGLNEGEGERGIVKWDYRRRGER